MFQTLPDMLMPLTSNVGHVAAAAAWLRAHGPHGAIAAAINCALPLSPSA